MNGSPEDIIQANFRALVGRLVCSEELFSLFIEKPIFTPSTMNNLRQLQGQRQSWEFITAVSASGQDAFDVLYDALVATLQFDLADLLKPELAPSRLKTGQMVPETRGPGGPGAAGASGASGDSGASGGGGYLGRPGSSGRGGGPQTENVRDPNSGEPDNQLPVPPGDDSDHLDDLGI